MKLVIKPRALKEIKNIEKKSRMLIWSFLDELASCENPDSFKDVKKLVGVKDGYRWRMGVYRILGIIKKDIITITIFRVGHRREVYRGL